MQKAVIFDLNGVFIKSPSLSSRFRDDFGVPIDDFMPALAAVMDEVRKPGARSVYECWKPHLEKWDLSFDEPSFLQYWFSVEEEDTVMTAFAETLKERDFKLFILSNNFKERADYYAEQFPFLENIFDKVYYSWQTGFVKPDERCFTAILAENNLRSEDCYYFDDSEKNVLVARKLGLTARRFESLDQVQRVLIAR